LFFRGSQSEGDEIFEKRGAIREVIGC